MKCKNCGSPKWQHSKTTRRCPRFWNVRASITDSRVHWSAPEPRYTKAERAARYRDIDVLRDRAVASWKADDGTTDKSTALVIMTYKEYLQMDAARLRLAQLESALREVL